MKYGVRVVCRPEIVAGFALAGLQALPVESPGAADALLEELRRQPEVGVILMEEGLHRAIGPDLRRDLARQPLPMLVPFAGPAWSQPGEDAGAYIIELLRQAIGYRVRVR